MKTTYSVSYVGYYNRFLNGGTYRAMLFADTLPELKKKIQLLKKDWGFTEFKRIEFDREIQVTVDGRIPVEALTKRKVFAPK